MLKSTRVRSGMGWTLCWYLGAALFTLPLAAVPMPSRGNPCERIVTDPLWAAWLFRDVLWFLLAAFLPVSAAVTAVMVWRSALSARMCAAVGVGVGFILVLASLGLSMATATCYVEIRLQ